MKKIVTGIVLFILVIFVVSFYFLDNQENDKEVYRVGVLMTGENRSEKLEGMKSGLSQLGYQLNQFEFIIKDAKDDRLRIQHYAYELVEDDLDLIVTLGGIETQLVHEIMNRLEKEIPVVFVGIAAPFELGLIEAYSLPGEKFTGINNFHMNLSAKRLEMFADLVPQMERVVVLYNKNIDISAMSLKIVEETANILGIAIHPHDVQVDPSLQNLESLLTNKDGIMILPSYQIEAMVNEIARLARKLKLPSMGIYDHEVEAGYLFGYGASYYGQGYQAARYVSLILQGNDPGTIPVELPDSIQFFVNEDVQSELNIEINEDLLKLAEKVRGSDQ